MPQPTPEPKVTGSLSDITKNISPHKPRIPVPAVLQIEGVVKYPNQLLLYGKLLLRCHIYSKIA